MLLTLTPSGWRVASSTDIVNLLSYIGGATTGGGKLKETGTSHWASPNTGALDTYGVKILPSGVRVNNTGAFSYLTQNGWLWRSSEGDATNGIADLFSYNSAVTSSGFMPKSAGVTVRLVRDTP